MHLKSSSSSFELIAIARRCDLRHASEAPDGLFVSNKCYSRGLKEFIIWEKIMEYIEMKLTHNNDGESVHIHFRVPFACKHLGW